MQGLWKLKLEMPESEIGLVGGEFLEKSKCNPTPEDKLWKSANLQLFTNLPSYLLMDGYILLALPLDRRESADFRRFTADCITNDDDADSGVKYY